VTKRHSIWNVFAGLALLVAACAAPTWQQVKLTQPAYDNETQDYGIAPTKRIRLNAYEAPTPLVVAGATTLTTPQLRDMLLSAPPPLLIDVLGGNLTASLPGAIWLSGAGLGSGFDDKIQGRLASVLAELTGGDKAKALVFFCLSKTCWLSYNASNRAVALGYSHVYWYRGGHNAWAAASLAMEPVHLTPL
jgi:PQQ-dependent catabolism-associated CXXCW motif protein